MAHFEIKDLTFAYTGMKSSRLVLDHINLTIEQGEYVTLCGKSGCGKSTLLKHLKSVLSPSGSRSGEILFCGKPLQDTDLRVQSEKIGFVMQNPDNQIVTDKVWHELAFGLENLGVDSKTIRLRVAEMASYFGIQNWFNRDVTELSGGQKQLLNLAAIMAMQPSVLILDEPTSQLDPIAAADFLNTVRKINLELGTTVIITEHRLEDILHASDKVAVMENGKISAVGRPEEIGEILRQNHSDMFTAMPVPVQFYYGLKDIMEDNSAAESSSSDVCGRTSVNAMKSDAEGKSAVNDICPLTVREGRNYLSRMFEGKNIPLVRIERAEAAKFSDTAAITTRNLWFRYEKTGSDILKNVALSIPQGSLFAIVGGNGTGKSTLLKSIAGVIKPYRGDITIRGKKLEKYKSKELYKCNMAMMPQDPLSLFAKKSVREELMEMLPAYGKSRETDAHNEKVLCQVSELCDIVHLLDTHPYDLSGGEQQRAALAKVLLTEPEILLLDEPTKGIDNFFKIKFADILKKLTRAGVTVVMVSHDVEFCARYADQVGMFFDGQLITVNTPNEFFSRNSFYTTAANRMSRHLFENAITTDDLIWLCRENQFFGISSQGQSIVSTREGTYGLF